MARSMSFTHLKMPSAYAFKEPAVSVTGTLHRCFRQLCLADRFRKEAGMVMGSIRMS